MSTKIVIGLIGLGVVGSSVYKTLKRFSDRIFLKKICVKDLTKSRDPIIDKSLLTDKPSEIINDPEIQIVIELIGGINPALEIILESLKHNKHVVTANKEVMAKNWKLIHETANQNNKMILYEGSVGACLPLLMPIKTVLCGNKITEIKAIINGTTNFILSKMFLEKKEFCDALKEAQNLGYAEEDPSYDVEGFDPLFKLVILSNLCFKKLFKYEKIFREGITSKNYSNISLKSMNKANNFGYVIKLVALGKEINDNNNNKYDLRVHPLLIKKNKALSNADYVVNCVELFGEPMGKIFIGGPGAGGMPTASSVVGDILNVAKIIEYENLNKNNNQHTFNMMKVEEFNEGDFIDIKDTKNKYFFGLKNIMKPESVSDELKKIGIKVTEWEFDEKNSEVFFISDEVLERNILDFIEKSEIKENIQWILRVDID